MAQVRDLPRPATLPLRCTNRRRAPLLCAAGGGDARGAAHRGGARGLKQHNRQLCVIKSLLWLAQAIGVQRIERGEGRQSGAGEGLAVGAGRKNGGWARSGSFVRA